MTRSRMKKWNICGKNSRKSFDIPEIHKRSRIIIPENLRSEQKEEPHDGFSFTPSLRTSLAFTLKPRPFLRETQTIGQKKSNGVHRDGAGDFLARLRSARRGMGESTLSQIVTTNALEHTTCDNSGKHGAVAYHNSGKSEILFRDIEDELLEREGDALVLLEPAMGDDGKP